MGQVRIGTQRVSLQTRVAVVIATAMLASIFSFALSAASPAPTMALEARWESVETYYLKLINCTRTGGWVKKDGHCDGYGSGRYSKYVAAAEGERRGSRTSRASGRATSSTRTTCGHGDPGVRLRRAGYHPSWWGENVGCNNYASVYDAVLQSHRSMQAEKGSGGGHWKNIKNSGLQGRRRRHLAGPRPHPRRHRLLPPVGIRCGRPETGRPRRHGGESRGGSGSGRSGGRRRAS